MHISQDWICENVRHNIAGKMFRTNCELVRIRGLGSISRIEKVCPRVWISVVHVTQMTLQLHFAECRRLVVTRRHNVYRAAVFTDLMRPDPE